MGQAWLVLFLLLAGPIASASLHARRIHAKQRGGNRYIANSLQWRLNRELEMPLGSERQSSHSPQKNEHSLATAVTSTDLN